MKMNKCRLENKVMQNLKIKHLLFDQYRVSYFLD